MNRDIFAPRFFWHRMAAYTSVFFCLWYALGEYQNRQQESLMKGLGSSRVRVVDIRVNKFGDGRFVIEPDTHEGHKSRVVVSPQQNIPKVGEIWRIGPGEHIGSLSFIERIQDDGGSRSLLPSLQD